MYHVYTMGCYSVIKKNEILPFVPTWMNVEGIMLSEINQSEKDKYYMISFIHEILKKKQKQNQKTKT